MISNHRLSQCGAPVSRDISKAFLISKTRTSTGKRDFTDHCVVVVLYTTHTTYVRV